MSSTSIMLSSHIVLLVLLVAIVIVDRKEHKYSKTYLIVGAALWVASAIGQASAGAGSFEANLMPLLGRAAGGALVAGLVPFILARILDRIAGEEVLNITDICLLFMVGLFLDWKLSFIMLVVVAIVGLIVFKIFKKQDFGFVTAVTVSTALVLIGYWVVTLL